VEKVEAVIAAVKSVASEEIMPRYLKVARQNKSDGSLYTQADFAAQESLTKKLKAIVNCPVLGEEMTEGRQNKIWSAGAEGMWCVDPIDGTSNFVNGLPYFAVSVAFMRNGRSEYGVVYDPTSDETFYAAKNSGAYLNGVKLPLKSHLPALHEAMAGIDFKSISDELAQHLSSAPPYASQRNFGASALDLCYVAAGRFDVYVHGGQKLWDYAAGSLIIQEAGGSICTLKQDDFWTDDLWNRSVIAAFNPGLFEVWKAWVRRHQ
jgi:myo-inositol-1(or 4)-monophosphatase